MGSRFRTPLHEDRNIRADGPALSHRLPRRDFLENLAVATGTVVLLPSVSACGAAKSYSNTSENQGRPAHGGSEAKGSSVMDVPDIKPPDWNALDFNRARGAAGAIPSQYMEKINGPGGTEKHLGKHLPYLPPMTEQQIPAGFVAVMFGDASRGFAKHPNAPADPAQNYEGHWYDWIEVKTNAGGLKSTYSSWPSTGAGDNGQYVAFNGQDITADGGKHTVYLVAMPEGTAPGSEIRVLAHCINHGEYVDFLTV